MDQDPEIQTWNLHADHVQAVLKWIRGHGRRIIKPEALVHWDFKHGQRLFDWNDRDAAEQWRVHQARLFLNSFRGMFDNMRVRFAQRVPANEATGLREGGYLTTEVISADAKLRAWAIGDITRRMKMLASELPFWNLAEQERALILEEMATAMQGREQTPPPKSHPTRRRRETAVEAA